MAVVPKTVLFLFAAFALSRVGNAVRLGDELGVADEFEEQMNVSLNYDLLDLDDDPDADYFLDLQPERDVLVDDDLNEDEDEDYEDGDDDTAVLHSETHTEDDAHKKKDTDADEAAEADSEGSISGKGKGGRGKGGRGGGEPADSGETHCPAGKTCVMKGNGKGGKGRKAKGKNAKARARDQKADVRCCKGDSPGRGAARVAMKKYGCNSGLTYDDAHCLCQRKQLNLCSEEQIGSGTTQGTGCGYDFTDVWLKGPEVKECPEQSRDEDAKGDDVSGPKAKKKAAELGKQADAIAGEAKKADAEVEEAQKHGQNKSAADSGSKAKRLKKLAGDAARKQKEMGDKGKMPEDDDEKPTMACRKIVRTATKPAMEKAGGDAVGDGKNIPDFCKFLVDEVMKQSAKFDEKMKQEVKHMRSLCIHVTANNIKNAKRFVFEKNLCAKLLDEPGDKAQPGEGADVTSTASPEDPPPKPKDPPKDTPEDDPTEKKGQNKDNKEGKKKDKEEAKKDDEPEKKKDDEPEKKKKGKGFWGQVGDAAEASGIFR